jgi:hypothetical protein
MIITYKKVEIDGKIQLYGYGSFNSFNAKF